MRRIQAEPRIGPFDLFPNNKLQTVMCCFIFQISDVRKRCRDCCLQHLVKDSTLSFCQENDEHQQSEEFIKTNTMSKGTYYKFTTHPFSVQLFTGTYTHMATHRPSKLLILFLCFLLSLDSFATARFVSALDSSKHFTSITSHQVNT